MKKTIIILFAILILTGCQSIEVETLGAVPEVVIDKTEIDFNGKKIKTEITDSIIGENLVLRIDKTKYGGFNKIEIYLTAENTTAIAEDVEFRLYGVNLESISRLMPDVVYEVDVNDYGEKITSCDNDWKKVTDEFSTYYECDKLQISCDSIDGKNCIQDNIVIGSHKENRYKDQWQGKTKVADNTLLAAKHSAFKSVISIGANEIVQLKIIANVPRNTKGQFSIEASGTNLYGLIK